MTRNLKLLPLISAVLAALSGTAAAQEDTDDGPWYSTAGCYADRDCRLHDPTKAFRLQFDLADIHKHDRATYGRYEDVNPGGELYMMFPITRYVGVTSFGRMAGSGRLFHSFVGPAFLPWSGVSLGVGPGVALSDRDDADPRGMMAANLYVHSTYFRIHGDTGTDFRDYRLASDFTLWPFGWMGIGAMVQDDTMSDDDSLVGFRLEFEAKPVNVFGAFTGGLRGDENAGLLFGIRLVPWDDA